MLRNITLIAVLSIALTISAASSPETSRGGSVIILPQVCRVMAGEKLTLELQGFVPSNAVVTWEVDSGGVAAVLPGTSAVLVAPSAPAVITVRAIISTARPGQEISITRQCTVTSADNVSG